MNIFSFNELYLSNHFSSVSKYRTRVKNILRRSLASVYLTSGDAKAAVTILGQMINVTQETGGEVNLGINISVFI